MAQMVKNLPAVQETRVWSLSQGDPLKEGMATHSSILAWEIPRTEEPGGLQSTGSQRVRHDLVTKLPTTKEKASVLNICWEFGISSPVNNCKWGFPSAEKLFYGFSRWKQICFTGMSVLPVPSKGGIKKIKDRAWRWKRGEKKVGKRRG